MEELKNKIKELARVYHSEVIACRRHIHTWPELSGEEEKTAEFIKSRLTEIGLDFKDGIADHGIIADIKGNNPSKKVIALRADMDALPITETNDVPYKSKNEGVMHACGHDSHVACLLGAARILNEVKDEFEGTIRLIFQPSEEKFPGGAKGMIEEGILKDPVVENVFGQHTLPDLEAGKVGFKSGMYMASTDEVYLTVKGRGGHAATPDLNIDSVVIAANIVMALQQVASRLAPPAIPTVLSFGRIIGDGRTNIIPDEVKIDGTLRTFSEEWRAKAHEHIHEIAVKTAESMGGSCEVFIDKGYPYLVNDDELTVKSKEAAIEYLGEENVVDLEMRMTAEDFAYFSQNVPSCFYRFGVRNEEKGITSNLHTSTFDIDEKSLETASGLMAWLAVKSL